MTAQSSNGSRNNWRPAKPPTAEANGARPARSRGWLSRTCRRLLCEEGGGVLVFVAVVLVPLLGMAGLALDGGRAYVTRARLSRAVDAGCLAAAKVLRQGRDVAEAEALAVAAANGVSAADGAELVVRFGTNADGEQTVSMVARQPVPTTFMRVIGFERVDVSTAAEATVPPVDLTLVVDRSGSLASQGAWDELQSAAIEFVDFFDNDIDQLGLVSFQVRAQDEFLLDHSFKGSVIGAIEAMNSVGDTNTGEGLRLAFEQMNRPNVREGAVHVVVFFTDGRPTAFRGGVGNSDRVMAVSTVQTGSVRGFFNNPDRLRMDILNSPHGCGNAPTCHGYTEDSARDEARQKGIAAADQIRDAGILLYTIGLGNPTANDPLLQPDLNYLELLANQDGSADADQPRGQAYFAPSAAELAGVFRSVARDLLVRLSR